MPEIATADMPAGWATVSLGDVVEVINNYWDRDTSIPERLIAGEHIDEGDIRIRRWGMTNDDLIPPTFNRRFQARDALLHSRNLDKVAQPGFGGITGEKIFILRSKDEEVLIQDLIPYLVASNRFRQYAESRWAGSTNKFLNKTPLMQYEFALPPLEVQRRMLEALQAIEVVSNHLLETRKNVEGLRDCLVSHLALGKPGGVKLEELREADLRPGWKIKPAHELCSTLITKGATPSSQITETNTGIPFLKVYNLTFDGSLDATVKPTYITQKGHESLQRSAVTQDDVLMNIVGPPLGKVSIVPSNLIEANINQAIARYRLIDKRMAIWLTEYLLSGIAQNWLYSRSKKTSGQRNLTLEICRQIPVLTPPAEALESTIRAIKQVRETSMILQRRSAKALTLKKIVIQKITR